MMFLGIVGCYQALFFPILALLWPFGESFIVHRPVGRHISYNERGSNVLSSSTNNPIASSIMQNAGRPIQAHPDLVSPSTLLSADLSETMTNVLIGIGGVVVVFGLVVAVFTFFIVPTAVRQVEELAKELDPALWQEYEQKLRPGETLAKRPELLDELGTKVLALQRKANEDELNQLKQPTRTLDEADVVSTPELASELRRTPESTNNTEREGLSSPTAEGLSTGIEVISKNKWDD
jgi:hypothetical protein